MKLERRNLIYSLLLAVVLVAFILCYFIFMLPQLFTDYIRQENLKAIEEQHRAYMKDKSYEGISLKNTSSAFSVELPASGDYILFTNAYMTARLRLKDERLIDIKNKISEFDYSTDDFDDVFNDEYFEGLGSLFDTNDMPIEAEILKRATSDDIYDFESYSLHYAGDDIIISENIVKDKENEYSTLIAVSSEDEGLIISVLPTVTTEIYGVRNVVLKSMPMIVAVILLAVLVFSFVYSTGIIKPLFASLEEKNLKLKEMNDRLEKENMNKELFFVNASHSLKTPVSAALLLVDGMLDGVGKYTDRDKYLRKVKEQLLIMRRTIDDILSSGYRGE